MSKDISYVRKEEAPILPPPASEQGILGWLWHNIFASMANYSTIGAAATSIFMILLTFSFGYVLVIMIWAFVDFAFISAVWTDPDGLKREVCNVEGAGACWPFIQQWFYGHLYGNEYPREEVWRVQMIYAILGIGVVRLVFENTRIRRIVGIACFIVLPVLLFAFKGGFGLFGLWSELTFGSEEAALAMIPEGLSALERVTMIKDAKFITVLIFMPIIWAIFEFLANRLWTVLFMLTLFPIMAFVFLNGTPFEVGVHFGEVFSPVVLGLGALMAAGWYFGRSGYLSSFGEAFAPALGALAAVLIGFGIVPLLAGGLDAAMGFEVVPTARWGGLLVTLVVALTGIICSLPIGIVLALGRRSKLPLIKWLCIIFIEVVRGIPLISVLFFASVMLSYFLPSDFEFNKLLRALVGVALFASAYMAEVIRGGLQAMPKGQYEGGMSLGLSYWQQMRLIILPQALTTVIPGIVNTFIGLFKDTTLVLIISIFDLLGIGQNRALKDIDWYGPTTPYTEYLYIAAIFFVFCFGMSRYSIFMENKLHRGHR